MFPITITIHDNNQLSAVLAALGGPQVEAKPVPATTKAVKEEVKEEVKTEVKKPVSAPAEKVAATQTTASESDAATQKAETSDAKQDSSEAKAGRTIDEAKALTTKIVTDKGRAAAIELLKKYGVPVAAKLAADQVDAFCADAEKVLS